MGAFIFSMQSFSKLKNAAEIFLYFYHISSFLHFFYLSSCTIIILLFQMCVFFLCLSKKCLRVVSLIGFLCSFLNDFMCFERSNDLGFEPRSGLAFP